MSPEEYQRLKDAEKEHLKKLKELKQAVKVLERQKKIQSELEKMSRASDDALQAQSEAVERLALETAHQEARLDVAMDSTPPPSDEALEEELRRARAQSLVERLKQSMVEEDLDLDDTDLVDQERRPSAERRKPLEKGRASAGNSTGEAAENPTTEARPEKTIGRM